jgi:hypothetical protein
LFASGEGKPVVLSWVPDWSCEELKAKESQPPSEKEKTAVEFLHDDLQAQKAFIDMIAAPVLNKMFECGLVP